MINNRIGVAYCARLPIAGPPPPPPYSRISRAIKHVRPFTGPCTFACVRASVHLLSRRRVVFRREDLHSGSGGDRSINYLGPAFAKAIKSAGGHDLFLLSREQNHHNSASY